MTDSRTTDDVIVATLESLVLEELEHETHSSIHRDSARMQCREEVRLFVETRTGMNMKDAQPEGKSMTMMTWMLAR